MPKLEVPVCLYEQYHCCPSHTDCRLYHICSQLPSKPFVPNSKRYLFKRAVPLSRAEIQHHNDQYRFYNILWGDLREKTREYCQKNHERKMEYQRQYRAKKNPPKEFSSVLFDGICDRNCENCTYDDCMLPTWENKQEYDILYYQKNREIKKQRSHEWYMTHRAEASEYAKKYNAEHRGEILTRKKKYWAENKERLNAQRRNKRMEKNSMAIKEGNYNNITIKHTTVNTLLPYIGKQGVLHIYQNNNLVFELDEERIPIYVNKSLGDFSVPSSNELWIESNSGETMFTRSYSNPLWEFEKA